MRTKLHIFLIAIAAATMIPVVSRAAENEDFGNRLKCQRYIAATAFIPKDSDYDVAPGVTFGLQWKNSQEAVFLDASFFENDASSNILWFSGDVRSTIFRLGYKRPVTKSKKLRIGADLQTQNMNFGSRKINAVTIGALAEYNLTGSWALQVESAQKTKRSGVYFGNFTASFVKVF